MSIKFVLNEEYRELDHLGEDYIYEATEHPSADDLMVIHFEVDGEWRTSNYTKKLFESKFKEGIWIKI